ncbi:MULTISPECIES: (2Fe-2S)-binding protein [Pseudomonas]|jgi:predicted molibdopterin-dependent oxidoreductase YjgC|uniref:(2Fe-2S)-binding protein n=1 Tax=Pseudomonas canavaninivorans TaxID=2842348 RepID=A0ABX8Q6Y9_PSECO|nr:MULTISPECIES: (2Fe-2S)-binding protein [Pseudomonas]MBJ2346412.1 (2Fe-2S)-binding protein [Pseudomonas canavaninivorans]MBL3544843.1 (2Fe-2S)-binding protein [Pseudomonas sp. HB05]QXI51024.1 (2Fe-2S)-binding protein [Pseudomonas alvandae]
MSADSLFRSLAVAQQNVSIEFEGQPLSVPDKVSLAAALLASGIRHTRESAISGRPAAPYCMMGVCFECLVQVDGQANVQSCLVPVRAGMRVRRQCGAAALVPAGEVSDE